MKDQFNGDNAKLVSAIEALLALDASGSLVPHGVGGHARTMLEAAAVRLVDARDALDTLIAVLNAIGYTEEFAETHPHLAVSEGVKLFLSSRAGGMVPLGWKIETDRTWLRVKRPDGTVSEWNNRPATNGTGMYDLCMALSKGKAKS